MKNILQNLGCEYLGTYKPKNSLSNSQSVLHLYQHKYWWVQEEISDGKLYLLFNFCIKLDELQRSYKLPFGNTFTALECSVFFQRAINRYLEINEHAVLLMSTDEGEDYIHANSLNNNFVSIEFDVDLAASVDERKSTMELVINFINSELVPYLYPFDEIVSNLLKSKEYISPTAYFSEAAFNNYSDCEYVQFLERQLLLKEERVAA